MSVKIEPSSFTCSSFSTSGSIRNCASVRIIWMAQKENQSASINARLVELVSHIDNLMLGIAAPPCSNGKHKFQMLQIVWINKRRIINYRISIFGREYTVNFVPLNLANVYCCALDWTLSAISEPKKETERKWLRQIFGNIQSER